MEDSILRINRKCFDIVNDKVNWNQEIKDLYLQILSELEKRNIAEDIKLFLLVELYKFAFYNDVQISPDERGDIGPKKSHLGTIKQAVVRQTINQKDITEFNQFNGLLRSFIDNPMKMLNLEDEYNEKL